MQVKESLRGLSPYQPGKSIEEVKREYGLPEIIKLASNENPYGSSPAAKAAIAAELDRLAVYPDGCARTLREKVAKHLGVKETQLLFGNGSDEVVQIFCRAFLEPGANTVMAAPTFPQYRHNAIIERAEVREVPLVDGRHDLEAMLAAIDENTRIVWICNPNNPTGTYVNDIELRAFLDRVPPHVLVVVDEAYYEYATAPDYPQTVPLLNEYEQLVVMRTFSKAYGLAALRVGYGVASETLIRAVEPAREPFNTSTIAQAAAAAALDDQAFIRACVERNRAELERYYRFCEENGLKYYPSQTNFLFIDFGLDGDEVFRYLLERGVIVRSGQALGLPTGVRVTVGTKEQNDRVLELVSQLLREKQLA
ncbi:histidinol-phosphate transaminase [Geobacillus thermoleovorans]|uniref:Histidinol-phosphate aminotransferase n=2 Tax=Geobacillus thermoleovorans group TaxID=1505648 RepID=A0A2Z3NBE8_GEOTH|nr:MULTISPECIES: histidinol-phosphate transaminase [Geobacillus]AUI38086.1 histidinol-phosphate transaminase [[Bacillus] caldolyticus]AWO75651.1 histidinol-phosphate transaminase [Geobacillus thermoleovorans]EQB95444.1 histidinol-phosphate aminotransferase [Geobacillus sp. A8]MED3666819.1 histidinol-phosphate transaminase [Geobacillus kaustophilus]ODA16902.1 histidinol-phosphate transaminase [Geobacillus thermoleovorans]